MIFSMSRLDYTSSYCMWNKKKNTYITYVYWGMPDDPKWVLAGMVKSLQQVFSTDISPALSPIATDSLLVQDTVWEYFSPVPDCHLTGN